MVKTSFQRAKRVLGNNPLPMSQLQITNTHLAEAKLQGVFHDADGIVDGNLI